MPAEDIMQRESGTYARGFKLLVMRPDTERLAYLFDRYVKKTCSYAELEELLAMQAKPEYAAPLQKLCEEVYLQLPLVEGDTDWEAMYETITRPAAPEAPSAPPAPVGRLFVWKRNWLRYAAAILLIGGVGAWLATRQKGSAVDKAAVTAAGGEIVPGTNKAMLTLADGSSVLLNDVAEGRVAQQGNAAVVKLNTGQLMYKKNLPYTAEGVPVYNKLSTPRGGQYQLILPDGTKVWLNAASSITFPTAFTGNERKVAISGEVYMEVAQDVARPFHVTVGSIEINVLGTSFNINAYEDEPEVRTTLLSGSIQVHCADKTTSLKPGQALILGNNGNKTGDYEKVQVVKADPDQVIAWKEGLFNFSGTTLPAMLRQLSRWYDVEIVYLGKIPERKFGGKMQRNLNLSQVLNLLETMEIDFKVEGRKLLVKP